MRFPHSTDDDPHHDAAGMDDAELLRQFASGQGGEEGAEAFAVLARRHMGLVLDIALRVTGSRPLAEEIVQTVFVQLARKAARVAGARVVTAWLHRTALLESRAVLRSESRRRKHTAEAAEAMAAESSFHSPQAAAPDPRMTELLRSLDEALESLPDTEREVLLSHYYGRQSYQEAGQRLGTSEAGARQLAARARKRLAAWFRRRHGAEISLSGVSTLLAGHFPFHGAATTGGGVGTGTAGLAASASASASGSSATATAAAVSPASSHALLAESATRAALSAAARSGGGMLSGFLPCLPFMKLPAALCLIAGFLISFLPGSGMGKEDTAAKATAVKPARPQLPLPSRRSPPGAGAAAAAGKAKLAEGFDPAQFERELGAVVELSRKRYLGFGMWSNNNFAAARAFDLSYGRQMQLARLVMYQPVSQMPALLEVCRRADPEAKGTMVLEAVFARWAEADPDAAGAAMAGLNQETRDCALNGICGTLIRRDVAAAARFASLQTQHPDLAQRLNASLAGDGQRALFRAQLEAARAENSSH